MSWRDYKDKKKKNILEENDSRQNQQKFVPKKETSEENKTRNMPTNNQQSMSTWDKIQSKVSQITNSTVGKFVKKELEIGNKIKNRITNPTQYLINETTENWKKGVNYLKSGSASDVFKGWVDKGALSDGYQLGDVTKSTVATTQDVGKQIVKGSVAQPRRSFRRFNEYSTSWIL